MERRKKKIIVIFFTVMVVFCTIVGRMFYLTVIKYDDSDKSKILLSENSNRRVDIVDRNNIIVASDINTKTLYLNRDLVENEDFITKNLSKILGLDHDFIYKKITDNLTKSRFILIKKHVLPKEEAKIRQLPIASVVFENDLLRFYPHNNLFSHIVGYTDIDKNGIIGIEEYYDEYLKNPDNKALKLTLDVKIQGVLREELLAASAKYNTRFIVGIIMEIETGNVLAIVSLPDFNPNILGDRENTFNFATYGSYELGSVFKIFTFANGFETGVIDKNSNFDVNNDITYGNFVIKDTRSIKNRKNIGVSDAFALSSNISAVQIARKIGVDKQTKFFERLGLLEKINTDIKQVILPMQPRKWREINLMSISYGYGLAVSPLHLISAVNAILNDGNLITPRFSYNFEMQKHVTSIISEKNSQLMRDLFRLTTLRGTGKLAYIGDYDIGGKTGTAEKISKDGYRVGEHLASFVAAFPMSNPKYSIFIVADRPKSDSGSGDGTGGSVAATIARNIILKIVSFVGIRSGEQGV
ncbi:MAG: penicillin-binding protein 2 [Rickettsiales bacterium]|jgi:cell division protein FtsI (penicillin-binding protein 3)|nr:penicillin-binding protein 2 [Rickettsiales bacterium]